MIEFPGSLDCQYSVAFNFDEGAGAEVCPITVADSFAPSVALPETGMAPRAEPDGNKQHRIEYHLRGTTS